MKKVSMVKSKLVYPCVNVQCRLTVMNREIMSGAHRLNEKQSRAFVDEWFPEREMGPEGFSVDKATKVTHVSIRAMPIMNLGLSFSLNSM